MARNMGAASAKVPLAKRQWQITYDYLDLGVLEAPQRSFACRQPRDRALALDNIQQWRQGELSIHKNVVISLSGACTSGVAHSEQGLP
jgi:hypothetical protein